MKLNIEVDISEIISYWDKNGDELTAEIVKEIKNQVANKVYDKIIPQSKIDELRKNYQDELKSKLENALKCTIESEEWLSNNQLNIQIADSILLRIGKKLKEDLIVGLKRDSEFIKLVAQEAFKKE